MFLTYPFRGNSSGMAANTMQGIPYHVLMAGYHITSLEWNIIIDKQLISDDTVSIEHSYYFPLYILHPGEIRFPACKGTIVPIYTTGTIEYFPTIVTYAPLIMQFVYIGTICDPLDVTQIVTEMVISNPYPSFIFGIKYTINCGKGCPIKRSH